MTPSQKILDASGTDGSTESLIGHGKRMSIAYRSTGDLSATYPRAGAEGCGTSGRHRPATGSHRRVPGATGEGRRATAVLQAGDVRPTPRAVCTIARSEAALRARSHRRVGCSAGEDPGHQCGLATASDSTKATTTQDRVPAILGTPADRVPATGLGIALRLLRDATDHHPYPRHQTSGDGRGEAVHGRRGEVHLRLFPLPRRLPDADHGAATAGCGKKPLRAEHPRLAGDLEVSAPLAGLSAARTAIGSAEAMVVAGAVVRAVESDGPGFATSGATDLPAGARQRGGQRRRNRGADAQTGARQDDHGIPQRLCGGCRPSVRVLRFSAQPESRWAKGSFG